MAVHDIIRKAIQDKKLLQIDYNDGSKKTTRTFEPTFLFQWGNHYYTTGYCHLREDLRTLKLSRIHGCQLLNNESNAPIENILHILNRGQISHLEIIVDTYPPGLKKELQKHQIRLKEDMIQEYPKDILLPKMQKAGILRSPLEEKVINRIIEDPEVTLIELEPFGIPYEFEGKERNYIPDVLVHYQNGNRSLIEIKVSGDIDDPKNQAKFQAAQLFCEEHEMNFSILGVEGGKTNSKYYSPWDGDDPIIEEFPAIYIPPETFPPVVNRPRVPEKVETVKPDLKALYIKKYLNPEGVEAFMTEEQNVPQQDTKTLKKLLKTELKMVQTRIKELQEIIYDFEQTEEKIVNTLDHLESKEKGEKEGFTPITSLQLKGKRGEFVYDPILLSKGLWKITAEIKDTGYSLSFKFQTNRGNLVIYETFKHPGSELLVHIDKPVKCYPAVDASYHESWKIDMNLIE